MTSADYRANARSLLGGQIFAREWLMATVACLVTAVCGLLENIPTKNTYVGAVLSLIGLIISSIIAGPVAYGICSYFLRLSRYGDPRLENVIDGFTNDFVGNFVLSFMQGLFIFLWSLLLIIPGIIKSYAYSMAFYIKNDHPEYGWKECLDESQRIMNGNKWRLFCLQFSFIGWYIVGALCLGIGTVFVTPYVQAAVTEFYEDIK